MLLKQTVSICLNHDTTDVPLYLLTRRDLTGLEFITFKIYITKYL